MFDALTASRVRLWATAVLTAVVALVSGSLLFPRAVYGEFIWHYFWGPVYADANGAYCAVWDGGARTLLNSQSACASAMEPVAYPGYTFVSEVGYMLTLIVALYGVYLFLEEFELGGSKSFFFALFPFMFFGGALRVVEDAMDAARGAGVEPAVSYPLNALIISPVIYGTVFVLTVAALVGAVWLERTGRVRRYEGPLALAGVALTLLCIVGLSVLSFTTEYVGFHPIFAALTLLIATVLTAGVWAFVRRYLPAATLGTPRIGPVVIWAHAVDGIANVLASDWATALGLPFNYSSKHPVDRVIVNITEMLFPGSVVDTIGDSWGFPLVKLVAATGAVWLFDDTIFEESPRYAVLLLVAIVAVGLGPGTRDMLRATFGI